VSFLDRARSNPNQTFDELKRISANARLHQDREVWLNVAYYLSEQHAQFVTLRDGTGHLVRDDTLKAEVDPSRQGPDRPVINKIMHFVNEQLAFSMQTKPTADVLPATDDPVAQGDANVANAYVQYLQEPNVANWEMTQWSANFWALLANQSYIKWVYNPKLGRPDIFFVPSTDLYVDPYATDFYKARWVIHSQFLDPEQVFDTYGIDVPASKVEKADAGKTALLRELGQSPVMEGVTVNELWMLPSRRYPKGLFRVWSGKEALVPRSAEGDAGAEEVRGGLAFPYRHGQIPFTYHGAIPRPNSQFCAAPVSFLRSPQQELNEYHWQRLLTRKAWALLKLWLPEEIELEQPWDNSPDQILRGSSSTGAQPQIIGPPGAMPDNGDGDWLKEEMGHVVGVRPVSEGQTVGRVEAARALELLREADTSRLAYLIATQAVSISRGWWQALMLARQYRREEIVVEAYSQEGIPEVHRFFSNQFKPGMRIRVTAGTGLAFSRSTRIDQLTTLWEKGIIRDPEAFAQLADIPTPATISAKVYDARLARNENLTLADAQAVTANSWDDHTVHIREHNKFRKTAEFAAKPDEVKARFEHHVQEHKGLEIKQLQEEAQKAQLMAATLPPGAPPGPQPGDNSGGTQGPPGSAEEPEA
jgi:hypothetical protein